MTREGNKAGNRGFLVRRSALSRCRWRPFTLPMAPFHAADGALSAAGQLLSRVSGKLWVPHAVVAINGEEGSGVDGCGAA